jgi:hypothetical protein
MLLIASRRLERAILAKHGLRSHLQYAKYIQDDDLNAHTQEHHMDANMLKVLSLRCYFSCILLAKADMAEDKCLSFGRAGVKIPSAVDFTVSLNW